MFSKVHKDIEKKVSNNDRRPASPSIISSDLTLTGDIALEDFNHFRRRCTDNVNDCGFTL